MAKSNFRVFAESVSEDNVQSDSAYETDPQRVRGVVPGVAEPALHNKLYKQVSIMAAALGQVMAQAGNDAVDSDYSKLVASIRKSFALSVNGVTPDSKGNIDITRVIDEIREWATPDIGQILITRSSESPARKYTGTTWELLQGGLFLSTAGNGIAAGTITGSDTHRLTENEMPAHAHSASVGQAGSHSHSLIIGEAGGHSHDRGTMNITGGFPSVTEPGFGSKMPTGAFYLAEHRKGPALNNRGDPHDYFGFDASKTWEGNTGWNGVHTHIANMQPSGSHSHSITIGRTGGGVPFNIRPRNIAYYMWIRTK